ncbi:MAG: hypothetical protein HRT86_12830 [Ilumatobacteraceae bacterium]|nr:hypothetical protein [Ilumatobacteraceae bacterium]
MQVVDEYRLFESERVVSGHFAFLAEKRYRRVWRFDLRDGSGEPFAALPHGTADLHMCLSPSGQRIALGSCIYFLGHLARFAHQEESSDRRIAA